MHRPSNPFSPNGCSDWVPMTATQITPMNIHNKLSRKPQVPLRSFTASVASHSQTFGEHGTDENLHGNAPPVPPKPSSLGSTHNWTTPRQSREAHGNPAMLSRPVSGHPTNSSMTGLLDDELDSQIEWKPLVPQ